MSGFSFPPPPPPPPKAAQSQGFQADSQHDTAGSGRSRGRGGPMRGRGRGFRGHNQPPSVSHQSGQRYDATSRAAPPAYGQPPFSQTTYQQNGISSLPAGSFVNPNFFPPRNPPTHSQSGTTGQNKSFQQSGSTPRTAAGYKRKLDALRGPVQDNKAAPPTAPVIPSFGTTRPISNATSPASPSQTQVQHGSKPQGPGNRLGLTPADGAVHYSSSDSEEDEREVDEEALYAEIGDKLTFEHNGVVVSLASQADLVEWKKERQKKWPTKARMVERQNERQRVGDERKRLLSGARSIQAALEYPSVRTKAFNVNAAEGEQTDSPVVDPSQNSECLAPRGRETELEKARREVAEQTKRLEELREQVARSEARHLEAKARSMEHVVAGTSVEKLDYTPGSGTDVPQDADPAEGKTIASGDEESSLEDSSSEVSSDSPTSEEDDSDEGPEEISSKPAPNLPTTAPRPAPVCKYFAATGNCRDGDKCSYRHERRPETTNGLGGSQSEARNDRMRDNMHARTSLAQQGERKSIYQRLLEQQEEEADRLALKVIKYLGQAGFFSDQQQCEQPGEKQ